MNEYEIAHLANRVTGLVAAGFAGWLTIGYIRVLTHTDPLVRSVATSIVILTVTAVIECLRVVATPYTYMHSLAVFYNIAVMTGSIIGLRAQYYMIPEQDRDHWRWWSAPAYPPWAWISGLDLFISSVKHTLWRDSRNCKDRRKESRPIDFPDRRKK